MNLVIKTVKEKNGVATVLEINGMRYVLEQQGKSKLDKSIAKKQKEKNEKLINS